MLAAVSCNGPTGIKLSTAPTVEQKHYKGFREIPDGASLIGESFTLDLTDAEGNAMVVRVSVHRPTPDRIEITVDDAKYALADGGMEDLIDITRRDEGIAFKGRGEILPRVKVTGQAHVDSANMQKAFLQLKAAKKDANPLLSVEADVMGTRKNLQFSVEQVKE